MTQAAPSPSPTADRAIDAYGPVGRSAWMDIDWREHQRWVRVGGRAMNIIELGEGEQTIVFVHGLGGSWQNWLENLPAFARDHRVIAVDLPGFGHSELPEGEVSISRFAECLDELCAQLDIEAAAWVGNSMGGFIAAELAITRPHRVERLVLVSAAGLTVEQQRNDHAMTLLYRLQTGLAFVGALVARRSDFLAGRTRLRRAVLDFVCAHPDRLPAPLVSEQLRGTGKPGFLPALDALTSYPIRDRLEQIACPTLIVWGTDDRLVPLRDADEFERLIPDARKLVYEDTGHVPQFERPARFNRDVAAFLAE